MRFNQMNKVRSFVFLKVFVVALFLTACQTETAPFNQTAQPQMVVQEIESPAAPNSFAPKFSATDAEAILSWVEGTKETGHKLRFATLNGESWTAAKTAASGANWFVNWADVPSIVRLPDHSLVAHWLVNSDRQKHAYDVFLARSDDDGATWSTPLRPHRDNTQTEHGFVSLLPWTSDETAAVWLDGRKFKDDAHHARVGGQPQLIKAHHQDEAEPEMTLRAAVIDKNGGLSEEAELDGRACDCCQTAAARTDAGAVVVYRDRDAEEVRDVSIVRFVNGAWTKPQTVFADNWQINACPVNGPAIAANNNQVAVAWFTAAERAQVKVIFSQDAGATFGQPATVADGNNAGRVDLTLLGDGSAMVVWLDGTSKDAAIRARRVFPDGKQDEPITIAKTSAARASGFPRIAKAGDKLIFAWTEASLKDQPARVRTAMLKLDSR